MSRYTEEDLKRLKKSTLLQIVLRQPNMKIPRKLTTQPLSGLTKDKLQKLLTGSFGFVKGKLVRLPEQGDFSMHEQSEATETCKPSGQTPQVQDVLMREQTSAEADNGNVSMPEQTVETAPVETLGELDQITSNPDPPTSNVQPSGASADNGTPAFSKENPATTVAKDSSNEFERKETVELPSSLQMIVSTLPPHVSVAVRDYFMTRPEEVKAWQSIELNRKKKKPDFAVIRYIRQVLTLYERLKNHPWPTDAGTLRCKDLARILGFSSPWFTNARHILDEYTRVGPESGQANEAIVARFQERVAIKKGNNLLSFLRAQREIIERGAVRCRLPSTTSA